MTITAILETVTSWVQDNVCNQLKLKAAPDNGEAVDEGYQHKLVTPTAFPLFIPTADRKPPACPATIPCCCVQILEGEDAPQKHSRAIKLRLCVATWSPGEHGRDNYLPDGSGGYYQSDATTFRKSEDGWRDAWNFADVAVAAIERAGTIGGLRAATELGIKFGPFTEQNAVPNLWPFWYAWVEFWIDSTISRTPSEYEEHL